MSEKFNILANFIKDMSSETPDIQSYLFVKENISTCHDIILPYLLADMSMLLPFPLQAVVFQQRHRHITFVR